MGILNWLDQQLAGYSLIKAGSTPLAQRSTLRVNNATLADDPVALETVMTISGSESQAVAIPLSNGLNSDVAVPADSSIRFNGYTAGIALGGLVMTPGPTPGQTFQLNFTIPYPITIKNLDPSSAADAQILTGTGSDVVLSSGQASKCYVLWDDNLGKFVLQSTGVHQETVDVGKDFGAYGDGIHDDTSAIDALNAFLKSSAKLVNGTWAGRTVVFPQGAYLTSHAINLDSTALGYANQHPNTTIRGIGKGQASTLHQGATLLYTGSGAPALQPMSVISGSNPSAVTLSGTPSLNVQIIIAITTGGARGTAIFKWSKDGGLTFTTGVATAATVSLAGTGLTASFAVATYTTSDAWTAYTVDSIISARSSLGFTLENLAILYTESSFTGDIVDLGVYPGTSNESGIFHIEGCTLGSDSAGLSSGRDCINLDGCVAGDITKCQFNGATNGIRGNKAVGGFGQTNQVTVDKCTFGAVLTEAGITNPGTQAIVIRECTFESTPQAVKSDAYIASACLGFTFFGNWCGDAPTAYRNLPWIDLTNLPTTGLIAANLFAQIFSGDAAPGLKSKDSIKLSGGGIEITGNIIGTIDFTTSGTPANTPSEISIHHNVLISGDQQGGSAPDSPWFRNYTESNNRGEIYGNIDSTGSFDSTLDTRVVKGHIITFPGRGAQPTIGTLATGITSVQLDGSGSPDLLHGSNDMCGQFTIVVASGTAAGDQFRFTYAKAFDWANGCYMPRVNLYPANAAAAALAGTVWADANRFEFTFWAFRAEAGMGPGTYVFNYTVIGGG